MTPDLVARQMDCAYCKSQIPQGATLCPICKCYQGRSTWRNWAPQVGASIALTTFVLAAVAYISGALSGAYRQLTAADGVAVGFLNSRGPTAYLNSGDHELFLINEDLECPHFQVSVARNIYKALPTSGLVTFGDVHPTYIDSSMQDVEPQAIASTDLLFLDPTSLELKDIQNRFPKLVIHPATGRVRYFSFSDRKEKTYEFDCVCIAVKSPGETKRLP